MPATCEMMFPQGGSPRWRSHFIGFETSCTSYRSGGRWVWVEVVVPGRVGVLPGTTRVRRLSRVPSCIMLIPLAEAVERYRRAPGAPSNSYNWYRKSAQRSGQVHLGGMSIAAVKVGNKWMVNPADVDTAIDATRTRHVRTAQMTGDYNARILNGADGDTVTLNWGGYRIRGDFHFVWNDQARILRESDGRWLCNRCWSPARLEHGREECHRCRDWSPCGSDCTLSGISCVTCGTSQPL